MNINKQTITWQLILEDEIAYKTLKILLLEFSPSKYELRKHINYWIKTKDYASWKFRLEKLRENKKSSSLEMYIVKFGTELGTEKYNEKLCIGKHSEENYIKKYGEEKGKEKWKFFKEKKKGQATIEYMIKRYGEEKGKEKWEQYQTKRNISYKKRKDLGIKQSNGRTLTRYVEMYGESEGLSLWSARNKKQSYRFSVDFYIEKYGSNDGQKKWNEYKEKMDKTSLKVFVKKYGEIEGTKRYDERCRLCNSGGMGLENCILKWGEEQGRIRHQKWIENTMLAKSSSLNYSLISQSLFWNIFNKLSCDQKQITKFAELNQEQMFLPHKYGIKAMFVDFKVGKAIIEFNGTFWHANDWQKERDITRRKILEEKDYFLLEIPEKDYEDYKEEVIIKCINFINKKWK